MDWRSMERASGSENRKPSRCKGKTGRDTNRTFGDIHVLNELGFGQLLHLLGRHDERKRKEGEGKAFAVRGVRSLGTMQRCY
jgi:hypothetical protein